MTQYRYKFTHADNTAYNGFKWEPGKWYETSGESRLCGPGWLHCYSDPLLAVLHNPIQGNSYNNPNDKLWLVEVSGETLDDMGLKEGWTRMRLIEVIEKPRVTTDQRIAYGIMCALSVYEDTAWRQWAHDWLSGADRTHETARATDNTTYAAYVAATNAAAYAVTYAATNAAAYAVTYAAANATYATNAARAADAAVRTGKPINLSHLATQALFY